MVAKTAKELFAFLAKQIESFLETHHEDHFVAHKRRVEKNQEIKEEGFFDLGFTFSFPVNQVGINKGYLIRWTKGFDIADAVGKDVCALLQTEIDALNLPVNVAALVNDTVGTLMARSYTSPGATGTLIGAIFGTGTNGAYVEKLENVTKMAAIEEKYGALYDKSTGEMIINAEWGSFDNHLSCLPSTPYDISLDAESINPGFQMFEKRISGMFLGEILRRALLGMLESKQIQLFRDSSSADNDFSTTTNIAADSPIYKQWGIDTAFLSLVEADSTGGLLQIRQALSKDLAVDAAAVEDCQAVKTITHAIGKRAARLSALALGAVILETKKLETEDVIDIGVDGSVVEFYPGFEDHVRQAFREIEGIGAEGEKRIRLGIAKDGSGVGAALIALVAGKAEDKA